MILEPPKTHIQKQNTREASVHVVNEHFFNYYQNGIISLYRRFLHLLEEPSNLPSAEGLPGSRGTGKSLSSLDGVGTSTGGSSSTGNLIGPSSMKSILFRLAVPPALFLRLTLPDFLSFLVRPFLPPLPPSWPFFFFSRLRCFSRSPLSAPSSTSSDNSDCRRAAVPRLDFSREPSAEEPDALEALGLWPSPRWSARDASKKVTTFVDLACFSGG
eukprot:284818051_6